ncbi:hypothetical protein T4C_2260 [Trichinella pseudospiralis]|uniref:Uncharacterized protein n=1 Tax=Trichinella pseudospiralis TaxID=6337 RepID=A0A0V1ISH3_TRIPS|nr:hypothetical protein T4C_2260 [Trichinella pseudospiralis]
MVKDFVLTKLRLCEKAACTLCGSIEQNPWEKAVSVVEKTAGVVLPEKLHKIFVKNVALSFSPGKSAGVWSGA